MGSGKILKKIIDLGNKFNLYPRTWKTSVMFAPPKNRTRCLFTVWTNPVYRKVKVYVVPSAFVEFFKLSGDKVEKLLGEEGWRHMDHEEIENFCNNIEFLLQSGDIEK